MPYRKGQDNIPYRKCHDDTPYSKGQENMPYTLKHTMAWMHVYNKLS